MTKAKHLHAIFRSSGYTCVVVLHDTNRGGRRGRDRERVCVCVCVCARTRAPVSVSRRGGGGEREKEREEEMGSRHDPKPRRHDTVNGSDSSTSGGFPQNVRTVV